MACVHVSCDGRLSHGEQALLLLMHGFLNFYFDSIIGHMFKHLGFPVFEFSVMQFFIVMYIKNALLMYNNVSIICPDIHVFP